MKVVGEGGNLGLTQRGRIEYALAGGRVNTDAIDNSAGVDTSDHEVNIKIALNRVVDSGELDAERPGRPAQGDGGRGRGRRPQQQPRAERDAGRGSVLGAQPARRARALPAGPGAFRPADPQRRGAARRAAAGRAAPRRAGAHRPGALGPAGLRQAADRRRRAEVDAARRPGARAAAGRVLPGPAARAVPGGDHRAIRCAGRSSRRR